MTMFSSQCYIKDLLKYEINGINNHLPLLLIQKIPTVSTNATILCPVLHA